MKKAASKIYFALLDRMKKGSIKMPLKYQSGGFMVLKSDLNTTPKKKCAESFLKVLITQLIVVAGSE